MIRLIGEIGINHNGSMAIAKKLIDVASFCGVWAVKFQKRNPDVCVPEDQKYVLRETPWGELHYIDYRRRMEFGTSEYEELFEYAASKPIEMFASVWDLDSVEFLTQFSTKYVKIPSAKVTDLELVQRCGQTFETVFVGTGMSTMEEVEQCYETLAAADCRIVLMQCNSSYPAQVEELDLRVIQTYGDRFEADLGYSGHEFGLIPSVVAAVLGAEYVERHITLDRTSWGSDHMASIEPHGLMKLSKYLKSVERSLGSGEKRVYDSELTAMKKLRGAA